MQVYGLKAQKFHTNNIRSLEELEKLHEKFDWLWVDCPEPTPEELNIIAQFTKVDLKSLEAIKSGKTFPHHRRYDSYTLLSISFATMEKGELKTFPIYIIISQKAIFTLRTKESSPPVEYAIQALKDSTLEVENLEPSSILCEVLRENTNRNLDVVMALREVIEKLEEKAMAKPSKTVMSEVFTLRKQIATFYRILWNEQQIVGGLKNGLIPNIKLCERSILSLEDTMNNISRELEFLTSYDNALDGVLRLQDLSMIHRVERTLVYLTIITVIMNLILILLEMGGPRG
ncbi:MAG: CorA family divalent cation transporter [Candidatus Bathyarchaeia archaeon]